MYKRVPMNKPAHIRNLDDPIVEYIHLYRPDQEHFLINLPRGKYIVCADYTMTEAHSGQKVVLQHDCFETTVDRLDNNSESKDYLPYIVCELVPPVSRNRICKFARSETSTE